MAKQSAKTYPTITFKICLVGYSPKIWRTVCVPAGITLPSLHSVIQTAMGWMSCHLWEFSHYGQRFADHSMDPDDEAEDAGRYALAHFLHNPGDELSYLYDFGDSWEHRLTAIEFGTTQGTQGVLCLAGKRACPPEDVGGVPGFRDFLQAMADPKHAEHESLVDWHGGVFDPGEFDLEDTNVALKAIKVSTKVKRGKARTATAALW